MIKRIFFTKSHENDRNLTFLAFGRRCCCAMSCIPCRTFSYHGPGRYRSPLPLVPDNIFYPISGAGPPVSASISVPCLNSITTCAWDGKRDSSIISLLPYPASTLLVTLYKPRKAMRIPRKSIWYAFSLIRDFFREKVWILFLFLQG